MNIAIIPARGGSKRIPKKNIKSFLGKPIISYSIDTAIKSGLFGKVIVSTDDPEISEIANEYGAETPFTRPKQLSDDFSGTHEVIGHAVECIETPEININYVCCIYATAPFIRNEYLKKGLEIIKTGNWDSVIAATKFNYPIQRSFRVNDNGGLEMFYPENFSKRSQDLEDAFHDAGQFYWATPDHWKNSKGGFGDKNTIVEIPNYLVQDIDDLDDWYRAEGIYTAYKRLMDND